MVAGLPQRRGESLVTDTAACWRVKEQGSLVIPWPSPCDVLVIPWWSPCGPVAAFICIYHVQPGSRLDDSQKWITEVMGGFYWVDSWLADKTQSLQSQSHCSSSIRPKCFCPRSHMQRCLPRMTTASNWLNRWGLLMPSGTGASCSCLGIEKKKLETYVKGQLHDSYFSTTPSGLRPQLAYFSSTHLVGRWQHSPVVPATMTVRAFIPCTLHLECTPESAFWSFCINCIRATPVPTSALATKASIVCRLGSNLTRHSKRPCSGCCLVWLVERLCNVMDVFHILLLELRNLTRSRLTRGAAVSESSQATVQQDHNKSNRYSNEGKQCGS